MQTLKHLAQTAAIELGPPATVEQIAGFEAKAGITLTDDLRSLYSTCDGAPQPLGVYSLAQALERLHAMREEENFVIGFDYLPLMQDRMGYTACVCCDKILRDYVIILGIDDAPRVAFRHPNTLFQMLHDNLERIVQADVEWVWENLPDDFRGTERTAQDASVASQLFKQRIEDDYLRSVVVRFGITLSLDEKKIAGYLKDGHFEVVDAAEQRLVDLDTPAARQLLQRYQQASGRVLQRFVQALAEAGIEPVEIRDEALYIFPIQREVQMWTWQAYYNTAPDDALRDFVAKIMPYYKARKNRP